MTLARRRSPFCELVTHYEAADRLVGGKIRRPGAACTGRA